MKTPMKKLTAFLAAIVLTANHYWMDAVIAVLIFAGVFLLDRVLITRRRDEARAATV